MANGLVLIADDDATTVEPVRARLLADGYDVVVVADGAAAIAEIHRVELDVALIELALPGRGGLEVLTAAHHLSPETEVLILAERAELATALECIRRGAFDLLAKPFDLDTLMLSVERAVERRSLRATTTLFRASQELLGNPDPAELPATIVGVAARVLEADDVTLSLTSADGALRTRQSFSITPETRSIAHTEIDDALIGRIAAQGVPVLLPEDSAGGRLPAITLDGVRSCIVFPLTSGARCVGVLTLVRIADHRPYRRVDVERTGILASQALLAVENAALMHRMVEAERLAAIGNLAAGVAHEINNPLTYVQASASDALERIVLLRRQGLGDEPVPARKLAPLVADVEEALRDVCDGAQRIGTIARDLRALSRAENRAREKTDLSQIVRSAQRVTAAQLRATATLALELTEKAFVMADEGRLVQVFVNLIVNAVQAASGKPVKVTVTTCIVGDHVLATVGDNGPGIAPEHMARIFEPFFSTKTATLGTGLGLSLSRGIVAEHGGTIEVESEPGQGARFVLSFPAFVSMSIAPNAICNAKTRAA